MIVMVKVRFLVFFLAGVFLVKVMMLTVLISLSLFSFPLPSPPTSHSLQQSGGGSNTVFAQQREGEGGGKSVSPNYFTVRQHTLVWQNTLPATHPLGKTGGKLTGEN